MQSAATCFAWINWMVSVPSTCPPIPWASQMISFAIYCFHMPFSFPLISVLYSCAMPVTGSVTVFHCCVHSCFPNSSLMWLMRYGISGGMKCSSFDMIFGVGTCMGYGFGAGICVFIFHSLYLGVGSGISCCILCFYSCTLSSGTPINSSLSSEIICGLFFDAGHSVNSGANFGLYAACTPVSGTAIDLVFACRLLVCSILPSLIYNALLHFLCCLTLLFGYNLLKDASKLSYCLENLIF